ncbi:amino acid transporter [Komagataeibacter xylinus]|nr:Amino acid-polyamine-organocation superfamily protein [Komagataeibacter xylinus E25]RFP01096.1 amino acid transporter [Komagataeibacter xylinus]RFP04011.1 amino acid transporter [Komagataeibacter xylinus]
MLGFRKTQSRSSSETVLESLGYKQELKRTMSLTDVVVYGLIYMVPIAPMAVFGFVANMSRGMAALVYLVAATAMLFSAISYKEMALRYPVAGSVYSYVCFGMNSYFGYLAGWAILLDYLLLPALLAVFSASAMNDLWPFIPAWVWVTVFVLLSTLVNLGGMHLTVRMNRFFLQVQLFVLLVFVCAVGIDVTGGRIGLSLKPFYNGAFFSWGVIFSAVPIAGLSLIGFDAISTLNEEAEGGGESVSKATMIVLAIISLLFVLQVYLASLYLLQGNIPASGDNMNNAFYNIAGQAGGRWLKVTVTLTSALIAIFANSIASMATSSRLLFGMARDGQLPAILASVTRVRNVPGNALIILSAISLIVGIFGVSRMDLLTTLVSFGALTSYILINIAVLYRFGLIERSHRLFVHWLSPLTGTVVLGYALWNAGTNAKIIGTIWILIGIAFAFILRVSSRLVTKGQNPL